MMSAKHEMKKLMLKTGARLHAGLFSDHRENGRAYQGFGLMVDEPGFLIVAEPAVSGKSEIVFSPQLKNEDPVSLSGISARISDCLERLSSRSDKDVSTALKIEVQQVIPQHLGLGSGTQLAYAVGTAWNLLQSESVSVEELSRLLNRGHRSCIGSYGFRQGGLLIDAGVRSSSERGNCRYATNLPETWRVVLATPLGIRGLAGESEQKAFECLPPLKVESIEQMCGLLNQLENCCHEFAEFSEILREFGLKAGEAFAPVQGGRFAHSRCEVLFSRLEQAGVRGVAQSSWGPTMFAVCQNSVQAREVARLLKSIPETEVRIVKPLNQGARIAEVGAGVPGVSVTVPVS